MHELSLAQGLCRQLHRVAADHGAQRVLAVTVEVGALSNVVPALLEHAFLALREFEPLIAESTFTVRPVPLRIRCQQCQRETELQEFVLRCPHCTASAIAILQGEDLLLRDVALEIDEESSMAQTQHIRLQENLLKANDFLAGELRSRWHQQGTFVVNLLSAPGSGKTSLLEASLPRLKNDHRILVLEGDIETDHDAQRIRAVGVEAVQLTTGGACHLEAHMLQQAWAMLEGDTRYDYVFIENVGNLVCPSSFDLGEHLRLVLLSVTEGADKPAKYPKAFHTSQALAITKMDALAHFDFSVEEAEAYARDIQPNIRVLRTSARTGEGIDEWVEFLREQRALTCTA